MPSQKISQLPSATTTTAPDLYPLVQSGVNYSITFNKLQSAIFAALTSGQLPTITLTGDVTGAASGGSIPTSVQTVGGATASNIATATAAYLAAASSNTPSTLVKRDGAGSFSSNIVNVNGLTQVQPDSVVTDISTLLAYSAGMGILNKGGGDINPPLSGFNITVESGFGYIQLASNGSLRKITWPDTPATLPASATSWIYFDSTGTLQLNPVQPDIYQNVVIGRAVTSSTRVLLIEESGFAAYHAPTAIGQALRDGFGAVYVSGSVVAEMATRNLTITAGEYYFGERQFLAAGGNTILFTAFYQNGSGGFTILNNQTVVDNAQWDNGTGTLAPLTTGYYAKHSIYCLGDSTNDFDSEAYFLVYSQAQYSALTLAEQGSLPNPPSYLNQAVSLIASIIVQQGATHFVEVRDERPIISSKRISTVAATTFHSNLLGLIAPADDHTQYLHIDGRRAMTGDLSLGTHNITNLGTANGVTVENHHARHQPGGADEIPTAVAVDVGSSNAVGTSTSLSRADHVHKGVHSVKANSGSQEFGDLTLANGSGSAITDNGSGTFTIDTTFGPNELTPSNGGGLMLNYTTGRVRINGTFYSISAGSLTLGANVTNGRVYVNTSGVVTDGGAIAASPPDTIPIALYSTGASTILSLVDHRTFLQHQLVWGLAGDISTILPDAVAAAGSTNKYTDAGHTHAIATAAASTQTPNQANAKGVSTSFARADHVHNIPTGTPSAITPNAGNSQGSAAAFAQQDHIHNIPTGVPSTLNATNVNTQGTAAAFAQQDHLHAISTGTPSAITPNQTNATGTSANLARADHIHNIPTGTPSTLNATNANTQGTAAAFAQQDHLHAISTGTPSTQTPDQANATGSSANLARADHIHNIPSATPVTISSNANARGVAASFALSDHTHELTQAAASQDHLPQYDGSNWQATYPESIMTMGRATVLMDDWISGSASGELGWVSVLTGGGSTTSIVAAAAPLDANHPGIINITAGAAAARLATIHLGPTSMFFGGGAVTLECLFQLSTLTNAAFRVGFGDQTAADHNNGVYLEFNSGVSATNWLIKTAAAGTRTSTTTSVAATASAWHKLVITVNAAGTSASFTLDGTSLGTITTNIPTTVANATSPNIQADSLGATTTTIYVDYFKMFQRFTSAR